METPNEAKAPRVVATSRQFRNEFPQQEHASDPKRPSNFCKLFAGTYGKHFEVHGDGSVTIAPKAYVDDVAAFLLGCVASNPTLSQERKCHLARFIDEMDARAVERHGYSHNEQEKSFVWTPVSAKFTPQEAVVKPEPVSDETAH